jgi:uncharacterized protein YxjI
MSTVADRDVLAKIESSNRFLIQQLFKPIANEYRISIPAPGSTEEGEPVLFVKQKKMKIKEDIRFRVSPDDDAHLFMIKSKSVFEFRGRHNVLDADGEVIGMLEKDFTRSLIRSYWRIRDAAGNELFVGHISDMFSILEWLPFNFLLLRNGEHAGTYKRVLGKFRDRYVLEIGAPLEDVDRRLVLALSVALDALQDR